MENLTAYDLLIEFHKLSFEDFNREVIKYYLLGDYEQMRQAMKSRDFHYDRLKHYGKI